MTGKKNMHSFPSDNRGVAAIELGIFLPLIVLMVVATFDLSQGIYRNMQVQNAAQTGAQLATTRGFDKALISQVVEGSTGFSVIKATPEPKQFCGCASGTGIEQIDCKSKCSGGIPPATYVSVSAEGKYTPLIPYPIFPPSYQFKAVSTVRVQ